MKQSVITSSITILSLTIVLSVGCSTSETAVEEEHSHSHGHDHDHDDIPPTFQAAVNELRDIWTTISTAMKNEDASSAHHPLHDVGAVLGAVADLAAETDMPEEEWNEVKAEVDKLIASFNQLDSAFHEEEESESENFESIKSTINDAISALEAKLPEPEEQKLDVDE